MERAKNNTSIFMCYNNNNNNNNSNNNNRVMKQPWELSSYYEGDDHDHDHDNDDFFYVDNDGMMMMTWPPRSYTCSFCKREFRSAQALGGHMNVHRRDRAQLRQLSQISSSPNSSPNINNNNNNNNNNSSTPNHTLNLNLPPNDSSNNTNNNTVISPQTPSPNKPPVNFLSKKLTPPFSPKVVAKHASKPADLITRKQFECFKRKNNLVDKQQQGHFGNFNKSVPGLIRLDLEMNIDVGTEDLDLELRLGYN